MNENNDAIKVLAKEVTNCAKQLIKDAPFDHTETAMVTAYLGNNRYQVMMNGEKYTAISKDVCSINDIVYVTIVKNNYSNLVIQSSVKKISETDNNFEIETEMIDI